MNSWIRIELEYSIPTSQSLYGEMRLEAIYNSKPEYMEEYKEIKFDKCPSEIKGFINRVRYDEIWICRHDNFLFILLTDIKTLESWLNPWFKGFRV